MLKLHILGKSVESGLEPCSQVASNSGSVWWLVLVSSELRTCSLHEPQVYYQTNHQWSSDGQQRPHDQNQCGYEWSSANAVIAGTSFGDSLYEEPKQNRTRYCIHQEPGFWKVLSCPPTGILSSVLRLRESLDGHGPNFSNASGERETDHCAGGTGLTATRLSCQSPEKHLPFLRNKKSPKLKITSEFNKMSEHS